LNRIWWPFGRLFGGTGACDRLKSFAYAMALVITFGSPYEC
jgi:hypothetical protein